MNGACTRTRKKVTRLKMVKKTVVMASKPLLRAAGK